MEVVQRCRQLTRAAHLCLDARMGFKPRVRAAAATVAPGYQRLAVNLPSETHRALKLRAVDKGITIRQYLLALLDKEGIPTDEGDN